MAQRFPVTRRNSVAACSIAIPIRSWFLMLLADAPDASGFPSRFNSFECALASMRRRPGLPLIVQVLAISQFGVVAALPLPGIASHHPLSCDWTWRLTRLFGLSSSTSLAGVMSHKLSLRMGFPYGIQLSREETIISGRFTMCVRRLATSPRSPSTVRMQRGWLPR